MQSLADIYKKYAAAPGEGFGDKGSTHSYIDVYEKLLAPYRQSQPTLIEIGVAHGHSMAMWREYFSAGDGGGATLIGVDLHKDVYPRFAYGWTHFTADSTKACPVSVEAQIIIDDGSHHAPDQIATFKLWSRLVRPSGLYIIEDVYDASLLKSLGGEVIDLRNGRRTNDQLVVVRM